MRRHACPVCWRAAVPGAVETPLICGAPGDDCAQGRVVTTLVTRGRDEARHLVPGAVALGHARRPAELAAAALDMSARDPAAYPRSRGEIAYLLRVAAWPLRLAARSGGKLALLARVELEHLRRAARAARA